MNKLRTIGGKKYIILSSNKIMQAYIIINSASGKNLYIQLGGIKKK